MCSIQRVWLNQARLLLIAGTAVYLTLGGPSLLAAEAVAQPRELGSLIAEVLARNSGLASQRLRVAAQEALVDSAGALDDPQVSYSIAPSSFGDSIPSNFGNALGVRQNFQLSQTIPWPGKRALRSEKMAASAAVAQRSLEETHLELVTETRLLWAQWWYVNAALAANLEHQRLNAELNSVAETQYASGIGQQQDVLRVQSREVQLQHQHIVLQQEQRRLQAQLNYLLNQAPTTTLMQPNGPLLVPPLPGAAELEQWLLATHPALLELKAEADVALLNQRLIEKDDYPDLQFSLGYNEMWNESALRLEAGVSLNIPLDFGKRASRKTAAQYEYHSVQMELQNKRSELLSDMEVQLASFDAARHGIHLLETELLPRSEQIMSASMANYEGGGGNFFNLIDAQQQILDMQLLLSNTYAEQFIALTELNKLTGGQLWPPGEPQ